jgi:CheY-like chemotaxis protein
MSLAASRPRVIVADDEPVITHTIEHILNNQGFEAKGVLSGEDAVDLARHFAPDIFVSDIRMGELDGMQAAMRVRRISPACKVVLFSANLLSDLQLRKVRLLGFDFLRKPLHPVSLLAHLRMLDTRFMMEIPADEAMRILRDYSERNTEMVVEGRIFGEPAETPAVITRVMPTDMSISIRLTEVEGQPDHSIWLHGGRFRYAAIGDWPTAFAPPWRSVLHAEFEDGNGWGFRERW